MSELLPCPFCGGEAEPFNPFENTEGTWCVICSECAAATGFEQTEAEAIEAWNTRAERTCTLEYVSDWMGWHCLSCDNIKQGLKDQKPNYCPNCGAKVVDE